jgi:uncharacterized protein YbcC (UPF0753/DUF2309 family)
MNMQHSVFEEQDVLHALKHYLPSQAPLKDFIHHNTLHVFQDRKFYDALQEASEIFGYRTTLSLNDYRKMFQEGKINKDILERTIRNRKGEDQLSVWMEKLLYHHYDYRLDTRIGKVRAYWKSEYHIDMDSLVHPTLFRTVCSYLDQGISIWNFPVEHKGFLSSLRELERLSYSSLFKNDRARKLLLNPYCKIEDLLRLLIHDETLYSQYLFDQQFAHQGWSGMVSVIEDQPQTLLDHKNITLDEFIQFELLLEIDAMDTHFGEKWLPLKDHIKGRPVELFAKMVPTELNEVISLWQDAYEWTFYDQVLSGIQFTGTANSPKNITGKNFQAMFCIDDRECSLRRYIERYDPNSETFGTPGFFNVEFYYQPKNGKFLTKVCPAPVMPKYVIKEVNSKDSSPETDPHFTKHSHGLFRGWLISQTLGFWSAFKLFVNVFKPSMSPATTSSFKHMDKFSTLTIENTDLHDTFNGLQIGFPVEEMAVRVEGLLKSIGLVKNFAPIVYLIGHGASSINNTHYAGYDCGACSGRPGSVNARVMSAMANHPKVRVILKEKGLEIPEATQFIGGLHDTTRDEIEFYDEQHLSAENIIAHKRNLEIFTKALDDNAKERSRRFILTDSKEGSAKLHEKVKLRSVSLFEPRPELNHATNALCVIGRRELTKELFLDRRAFMNSYDYTIDLDGTYLTNILKPIGPVCGGINLEYYFSRVDNQKLGAGTKLPHNVMGLIGVANGIDGDLRAGLPNQMIEVHDPIRLMVIVEHYPEVVLKGIQNTQAVYEWFINEWVHIVAVHPHTHELFLFKGGTFVPYKPMMAEPEMISDPELTSLIESTEENLPVYILKS